MNKINSRELRGNLLLFVTAFIWGCAFVAQSKGAEFVGPFTFVSLRSVLGSVALLPFIAFRSRKKQHTTENGKTLWIGGVLCGIALCVASLLQQVGIAYTTVGNAGFITALYILIVPVLGIFLGKKVSARIWGCIGIAILALYLLTIKDGFTVSLGDSVVMGCALVFSVQILLVDYHSPKVDGVKLACIQFVTVAVLSGIPMLIWERPALSAIMDAALPIAYAGLLSSGAGYTFQILGQKYTRPAVASLIMSLESVFAVLAGIVLLGQVPSLKEGMGCLLMFLAIMIAQFPVKGDQNDQNA